MKVYVSETKLPITSVKRQPEEYIIPPWSIPNTVKPGPLGEWSPNKFIRITGGYINALSGAAGSNLSLVIVKNNAFKKNIVIGTVSMSGLSSLNKAISLTNPLSGFTLVSPGENIQMVFMSGSGYRGVTIQLHAEVAS